MPIPTSARACRRLPTVLVALAAVALTGCGDCCLFHHKKNNNNELLLAAAARQNGSAGGVAGGGTGSTGGGGPPGGGPGPGPQNGPPGGEIPEIHVGAAAGVLTLLAGASLILFDRRRRTSGPVACA